MTKRRSLPLMIILGSAAVLTLTSAKKESQMMQGVAQGTVQSQEPVTKTFRTLETCEQLALMPSDNLRAAGSAIAKSQNEAKSAAAADARNQLAQMMRVVVNTAPQVESHSNDKRRRQKIADEMMNKYVYQSVESTKPIHWSIYDLSDGNVQVYVCMEMVCKANDFSDELEKRVEQEQTATPATPTAAAPTPTSPSSLVIPTPTEVNPAAEALFQKGRDYCRRFNYKSGIDCFIEAVEMGSVNAQHFMGMMYLYGDNVEKDSKLAFQYLLSAANGCHKAAIFQVAEMYNSGTGVEKDKEQARYWYERADEMGDVRAESRLRRL